MANLYAASNGDNANDGLTPETPKQTLAAVAALAAAGDTVYLKRGSSWTGGFGSSTLAFHVDTYGIGARPFLDGTEVQTGWTLVGGATNRYEKSVTLRETGSASFFPMVFEDGVLLEAVQTAQACEDNAGTYFTSGSWASSPVTMVVHPIGSTNPATDSKEYRVSTYMLGIHGDVGVENNIRNVNARGFGENNGALVAYGGTLENCDIYGGGKHHGLADRCINITTRASARGYSTGASTQLVSFMPSAGGRTAEVRDVRHVQIEWSGDTSGYMSAHTAHAGSGEPSYDRIVHRRRVGVLLSGALGFGGATQIDIADTLSLDCIAPSFGGQAVNQSVSHVRHRERMKDGRSILVGGATAAAFRLCNAFFYGVFAAQQNTELFRNNASVCEWRNVTVRMDGEGSRKYWEHLATDATRTSINFCVFVGKAVNGGLLKYNSGTYAADHNIFHARPPSGSGTVDVYFRIGSTNYSTLSAWQTATGQDTNSVYLTTAQAATFWLGDPSAGDYRINPEALVTAGDGTVYQGTFPDGTPLTKAGAQPPLPPTWDESVWYVSRDFKPRGVVGSLTGELYQW